MTQELRKIYDNVLQTRKECEVLQNALKTLVFPIVELTSKVEEKTVENGLLLRDIISALLMSNFTEGSKFLLAKKPWMSEKDKHFEAIREVIDLIWNDVTAKCFELYSFYVWKIAPIVSEEIVNR
eukprot:UN17369